MSKKFNAALDSFLDKNAQLMFASLKNDNPDQFNRVMDGIMNEFLNLPLDEPKARKPRTATPKRKVRKGIGSY